MKDLLLNVGTGGGAAAAPGGGAASGGAGPAETPADEPKKEEKEEGKLPVSRVQHVCADTFPGQRKKNQTKTWALGYLTKNLFSLELSLKTCASSDFLRHLKALHCRNRFNVYDGITFR